MKANKWLGLIAGAVMLLLANGCAHAQNPPPAPPPAVENSSAAVAPTASVPAVSPGAAEVVRLAEAGTSEDVILAYIQNSTSTFDLSADQILYLRDVGLTSPMITAMLSRDNSLRGNSQPSAPPPNAPPVVQTAPPPAQTEAVTAPLVPPEGPPPTYVSSPPPEVSYFYDDLSPYGSWVQLDGVGWCWQPRVVVVNRAWRPYCDSGHWVYTDAGWFWQSDYSWGWAAFHYGRWHLHDRCGWVWLPDRVWGPAWVTWRSEGDHCGWAPLPPHAEFDVRYGYRFNGVHVAATFDFGLRPNHFTFIAVRDFHDHDFAHHRLPPTEVTRIYNHTTVINNYEVHNNTIINHGIQADRVAAATHTEIHKVAIRDVPAETRTATATRGGAKAEVAVYRPQLKAPARPVNMVAQKVDDRHPVIQHPPVVTPTPQRSAMAGASASPNSGRPAYNRGTQSPSSPATRAPQDRQGQGAVSAPNRPAATAPNAQPQPNPRSNRPGAPSASGTAGSQAAPVTGQAPNARPSYPVRSGQPGSAAPARPTAPAQSGSTYYPKGSPAGDNRDSRGQGAVNPRSQNSSDNGNKGQRGVSRKNDQ